MKSFTEWLNNEGLGDYMPNMGQRATPINNPQSQQYPQQPKQISLSSLGSNVKDLTWHKLYDVFSKQFQRMPNDPEVESLGQLLHQSATSGNYSILQDARRKYRV